MKGHRQGTSHSLSSLQTALADTVNLFNNWMHRDMDRRVTLNVMIATELEYTYNW